MTTPPDIEHLGVDVGRPEALPVPEESATNRLALIDAADAARRAGEQLASLLWGENDAPRDGIDSAHQKAIAEWNDAHEALVTALNKEAR